MKLWALDDRMTRNGSSCLEPDRAKASVCRRQLQTAGISPFCVEKPINPGPFMNKTPGIPEENRMVGVHAPNGTVHAS
jgi:hypothetical protein